jgi:hypothetical protein
MALDGDAVMRDYGVGTFEYNVYSDSKDNVT